MKAVIQRAKDASVTVKGEVIGEITDGFVVLLGVTHDDTIEDVQYLVNKIVHLRVFEDENEKMNLSLKDIGGSILSISQFTLYGDTRKEEGQALYKLRNQILQMNCTCLLTHRLKSKEFLWRQVNLVQ